MTQVLPTTMAGTLKASKKGLAIIDQARRKKEWAKTDQAWADIAHTSPATLRRFWAGIAIQTAAFKSICKCVCVEDWESIVDTEAIGISDITEQPTPETNKKHFVLELNADFETIDSQKFYGVVAQLVAMGVVKQLVDVDEGSIKLLFEGSQEDFEQMRALFRSGELAKLLDIPVKSVYDIDKEKLAQWIRKNGGADLYLSDANLSGARLSGAHLSRADLSEAHLSGAHLREANLSRADLSRADLGGADLGGADLSRANLSRANLGGAYLSLADLGGANLRDADLSGAYLGGAYLGLTKLGRADLSDADLRNTYPGGGANLSRANLSRANLSLADLRGANLSEANVSKTLFGSGIGFSNEQKDDLIKRGAIFDNGSRDREFNPVPTPGKRR
jgi:uncharacterized protein YjbI with pentapeptide repeats